MPNTSQTIEISDDYSVTVEDVLAVSAKRGTICLSKETANMLDERRRQIVDFVEGSPKEAAYGFNRGFGHNVKEPVDSSRAKLLQANLILSHSCGVGPLAPIEVVRGTMFLRACSLARGHSGVRSVVVQRLLDCLNKDVVPFVPRFGSVSASGDLAPLSHIALGLMGQGKVFYRGKETQAKAALKDADIKPLKLEMKEGLALNNGVQYSTAIGVHCLAKMETLLKTACLATALSTQVMLGADTPFRADLHELRPHPGARQVANWIFLLMRNSPIRKAHEPYDVDGEVQDPYNIRCAAQILGACAELLIRAKETLIVEMNSVTDNPVILQATAKHGWDKKHNGKYLDKYVDIVSGGHFHGMPVAVEAYNLLQAMAIIARLSNMRCVRYVDEARNKGLESDLKWPLPNKGNKVRDKVRKDQATWSGMMIPEYVSAGLTNWIWGTCMPSHLFSLSTDAGQEDHVSMAANVALRAMDTLPRLAEALAIELAFAAQAGAIRKEMDHIPSKAMDEKGVSIERHDWTPGERQLNKVGETVLREIYKVFPPVKKDRYMADELQALAKLVFDGDILRTAEQLIKLEWRYVE